RPAPGNEFAFWDLATGEPLRTLPGYNNEPGVAFSPNGSLVATCSNPAQISRADEGKPAEIQLWDAQSWQPLRFLTGHQGSIQKIAFSPDSTLLAGGSRSGIWVWDVATGELRRALRSDSDGGALVFAPHGAI